MSPSTLNKASNFEQVKSLVLQTAQDQITQSHRLIPSDVIASPFDGGESTRKNNAQTILVQAKHEAQELSKIKESPFQVSSKNPSGRIMAGMESV